MNELTKQLQQLSARLVATELNVAFRLVDVAKKAQAEGNVEIHNEALTRARRCREWILKFIDGVSEEDRPHVDAKFQKLVAALERFDPSPVERVPVSSVRR